MAGKVTEGIGGTILPEGMTLRAAGPVSRADVKQASAERALKALAAERGWTYELADSGHHVVRDQLGGIKARNPDPRVALEILKERR